MVFPLYIKKKNMYKEKKSYASPGGILLATVRQKYARLTKLINAELNHIEEDCNYKEKKIIPLPPPKSC